MISKSTQRFIRSLHQKKFREAEGKFIVEGPKLVQEMLDSGRFVPDAVYATRQWHAPSHCVCPIVEISDTELDQISALESPNKVLAVCSVLQQRPPESLPQSGFFIVLDQITDPGNLGTIIRTADWFGADAVFCSLDTVELYNPKVIQATMGSVFRIPVYYLPLPDLFIRNAQGPSLPVYATSLSGRNIYESDLKTDAFLVFGNESRGISSLLLPFITEALMVPRGGNGGNGAESLNVSVAAGIFCAEFKRRAAQKTGA